MTKKKSIVMYYVQWGEEDDYGHYTCCYRFHASQRAAQNTLNMNNGGRVREVHVPTDPKGLRDFLNRLAAWTENGMFQGCFFLPVGVNDDTA